MRIYLRLTKNSEIIPFNYQELLTSTVHKWIGRNNELHGRTANYSFSWIQNTIAKKEGINLQQGAYFFISSVNTDLIKQLVKSILDNPKLFCGASVEDIQIVNTPEFSSSERFVMASPVLLKERVGDRIKHVTIEDQDFEAILTENLKRKLEKSNISSEGISIQIDPDSRYRRTKLVTYKGIKNKTSYVPIVIKGNSEQIAFAWSVGLGNSTGIGFGALK